MLKIFLLLTLLLFTGQSDSSTFYVENVEARTEHDSRYIFERVSAIVPPDKLVSKNEVDCLVNELKASGIFEDVTAEIIPLQADTRKLVLFTTYRSDIGSYVISDVALNRLPEVETAKFHQALRKRDIKSGTPFLKYNYRLVEEKIADALREAYPNRLANSKMGTPWITIRPAGSGKVRLIVSTDYSGCATPAN